MPLLSVRINQDMDDFYTSLGHWPRRHPVAPQLLAVGYFGAKDHRVVKPYGTFNVSLVLAGSGDYRFQGASLPVVGPAVLTQWPWEPMDYGPTTVWRECYLVFPAEAEAVFHQRGLFDRRQPVWSVAEGGSFLALADEFLRRVRAPIPVMDRLDRLAELLVVESRLAAAPRRGARERTIEDIWAAVDAGKITDPEAEARRRGLSPSAFRRKWMELVQIPPARYAMECRLREGIRRLDGGDEAITTIAQALGFSDALYFSRRFRAFTGLSPVAWRQRARGMRG